MRAHGGRPAHHARNWTFRLRPHAVQSGRVAHLAPARRGVQGVPCGKGFRLRGLHAQDHARELGHAAAASGGRACRAAASVRRAGLQRRTRPRGHRRLQSGGPEDSRTDSGGRRGQRNRHLRKRAPAPHEHRRGFRRRRHARGGAAGPAYPKRAQGNAGRLHVRFMLHRRTRHDDRPQRLGPPRHRRAEHHPQKGVWRHHAAARRGRTEGVAPPARDAFSRGAGHRRGGDDSKRKALRGLPPPEGDEPPISYTSFSTSCGTHQSAVSGEHSQ